MEGVAKSSNLAWRQFKETLSLLALAFRPKRSRADLVYNMLGTHNNLAEKSLFLNLGYWAHAKSYDAACTALADELAKAAGVKEGQRLLDAGCGFGDAAAFWSQKYNLPKIQALNITKSQIDVARNRWAGEAVEFVEGSAMSMPFANAEFDAVLALESSFHFPDRLQFFREALRVLKPGGTLAIADFFPLNQKVGLEQRLKEWVGRGFWQIPSANWIALQRVEGQIKGLGFESVSIRDISPFVFKPFKSFAQKRVEDPQVAARLHPMLRKVWGGEHSGLERSQYMIMVFKKGGKVGLAM